MPYKTPEDRYRRVGTLRSVDDVKKHAADLSTAYRRNNWNWGIFGLPDAATVAATISMLSDSCRQPGMISSETAGMLVEVRGKHLVLLADRRISRQ